jgi:hypothetical protein
VGDGWASRCQPPFVFFSCAATFGCTVNHESAAAHGRMQQLISQQIDGECEEDAQYRRIQQLCSSAAAENKGTGGAN